MKKAVIPTDSIADRAKKLVYGPRAEKYGHPSLNFQCIAQFWESYLRRRGIITGDDHIVERDIANMNILVKLSRDAHEFTEDNHLDVIGYALTAERLQEK